MAFLCLLCLLPARIHSALADRVTVAVSGVTGELRNNVLGTVDLRTQGRRDLTPAEIEQLVARAPADVDRALQPFGYYHAEVDAKLHRTGAGRWRADLAVRPGPPVRLDTVDVRVTGPGSSDPRFRRIVDRFPLKKGGVLRHGDYENGKAALVQQAARSGYIDAAFDTAVVRVDPARNAASVVLHLDTHERRYFGPVDFDQTVLEPRLAEGYVPFRTGEPFDARKLLDLQDALAGGPYFRGAEITPRRDLERNGLVPIDVRLVPSAPRHLALGVGYGTDQGPFARVDLEFRRLNRRGHRLENAFVYSQIEKSASTRYEFPWVHPRTDFFSFRVVAADLRPVTSRTQQILVGPSLHTKLGDWTRTLSLDFDHEYFTIGTQTRTSRFLIAGIHEAETQNEQRIMPRIGRRIDLDLRGSPARMMPLSDGAFVRAAARGKWIAPLGRRIRGLVRVEAGTTWTDDFSRLPPTLRFFAGGAQSVRGFAYQAIGPRDASGQVIGGPNLAVASVEVDQRILPQWRVAAFYDAGSVFARTGGPIADAVGVGVRYVSPVGPVRLDAAMPLGESRNTIRFHFTVGPDL